jgi:hypothetical protein
VKFLTRTDDADASGGTRSEIGCHTLEHAQEARRHEPCAAVARSGPLRRRDGAPPADLRAVHRGARHGRPQSGKGAPRLFLITRDRPEFITAADSLRSAFQLPRLTPRGDDTTLARSADRDRLPAQVRIVSCSGYGRLRPVPRRASSVGCKTCLARRLPRRHLLPNRAMTQRCSTPAPQRRDRHPCPD